MFRCLGMQISHALLPNRTNSYRHPRGIGHMAPENDAGSYNAPRSPVYKHRHQFGGLFCFLSLTREDRRDLALLSVLRSKKYVQEVRMEADVWLQL